MSESTTISRARLFSGLALGAMISLTGATQGALAQDLQWRTLNAIVPVAAGGGTDRYTRQIMPEVARCLGTRVAVRNVPGDGHMRGIGQAARSAPDGQTLTFFNLPAGPLTQLARGDNPPVDLRELTYIGSWGTSTLVLYATTESGITDIDELIRAYNEGERVIGSQDRGGGGEVITHVMRDQWGLNWEDLVAYDGGGDLVAALLRNEVIAGVTTDAAGQSAVESGYIVPLASLGPAPSPLYPEVPTAAEQGYADVSALGFWQRVVAGPPGIPEERHRALERCLEEAINGDVVQSWSRETDNPVEFTGADETRQAMLDAFGVVESIPNFREIVQ